MLRKICSNLLLIFFAISFSSSVLLAVVENDELYEGWVWSNHLKVKFSNNQELDFFNEHEKLSKIIKIELKKYLEASDKKDRNIALIKLGFIIKNDDKYTYKPSNCFEKFLFVSGEIKGGRPTDFFKIDEKQVGNTQLHEVDPADYPLTVTQIQKKLSERFPVNEKESSFLDKKIYTKYNVEGEHVKLINAPISSTNKENREAIVESFKKLIGVTDLIHYRSTHSEQKILFFLEKSLKSIPPYHSFRIKNTADEALSSVEDYVSLNHNFLNDTLNENLENWRKLLLEEYKNKDGASKISQIIAQEYIPNREIQLKESYNDAFNKIKKLDNELKQLEAIEQKNPLKLSMSLESETKKYKDALESINNLIKANNTSIDDHIKAQKSIRDLRKKLLPEPKTSITDWKSELEKFFSSQPEEKKIEGVILHIHSLKDVCENCCPSIAREFERKDGFITYLKSMIMAHNGSQEEPMHAFTVSCDYIREGCENRYSSKIFNPEDNSQPVAFSQVLLKEAKAHKTLNELDVKKSEVLNLPKENRLTAFQNLLLKEAKATKILKELKERKQ